MDFIKKAWFPTILGVASVYVLYIGGKNAIFNICIFGFVALILSILWSNLGLETLLSPQFRERNRYQARIRLIDVLCSLIFFSIGLSLAFFFLGFEANNLNAYNKDNEYNWLYPSDIIRFPLDQFKVSEALQKPIPQEIDLKKPVTSNTELVHCFVLDLTKSTLAVPKRESLEAEFLKEMSRRKGGTVLKDTHYTIPERLPYVALSQLQPKERAAFFFYLGEQEKKETLIPIKWNGGKTSEFVIDNYPNIDCPEIDTYFDSLKMYKRLSGKETTNFVKLLPEIAKNLKSLRQRKNEALPADISLNIISDFQDDINNEDNLKMAISEFAKNDQIKKINLIIIPIKSNSTSINSVLHDFILRTFKEQFKNKIGTFSAIERLNSLTTLIKAESALPSKTSFYYSQIQDSKATTHFQVKFPSGGCPIFELKSEQSAENPSVGLKLNLKKMNVSDSIELRPNEPLIFPDSASLGKDTTVLIEATFTGVNYANTPKFSLCITDKHKYAQEVKEILFKPILSKATLRYLLLSYNLMVISFFLILYFWQRLLLTKLPLAWYQHPYSSFFLYVIAGFCYLGYIGTSFDDSTWTRCTIIIMSITIHVVSWVTGLFIWHYPTKFNWWRSVILLEQDNEPIVNNDPSKNEGNQVDLQKMLGELNEYITQTLGELKESIKQMQTNDANLQEQINKNTTDIKDLIAKNNKEEYIKPKRDNTRK